MLMRSRFFRFIPHLLKIGFSTVPRKINLYANDKEIRISKRRISLIYDILRLQDFHLMEMEYISPESVSYSRFNPKSAHKALAVMWRSIPDALLSQKEMTLVISNGHQQHSIEELQITYERIVGPYPSEPTPRSLTHYCRIVIRKFMAFNLQLPHGISKLDIPTTLLSFLRLEC
ncbi:unnamed protein product [Larinioides sclopetarius]|uniref:SOCS box domain-containing protein n=1 Tax=Larinioides sclopetarius TaxID=280406 RepID=A0AAV2BE03_9ARAC